MGSRFPEWNSTIFREMLHNIIGLQSRALVTLVNTMPNKEIIKTHQPGSEGQVGVQERTTLDNFGRKSYPTHTHTHALGPRGQEASPETLVLSERNPHRWFLYDFCFDFHLQVVWSVEERV